MIARIFRPAKTAMQSGKGNTQMWVLEYEPGEAKRTEPLMGYTSSSDMLGQIRLKFDTREEAVDYAERNNIAFRVIEPKEAKRRPMAYADNFAYGRQMPWTH